MVNPSLVPRYKLSSGHTVPVIGLGTWQSPPDGTVYRAVVAALNAGYRHLDCAYSYGNHQEIGNAIKHCITTGVLTREELFVTSKITPSFFHPDRVALCAQKILTDLQLDYLDLLLLHAPFAVAQQDETLFPVDSETGKLLMDDSIDYVDSYHALEKLVDTGLTRSIGVSNYNLAQMERLLSVARIPPVTNQIESHPYLVQQELKQFCNKHNVVLTAYSPLGNPGNRMSTLTDEEKKKLISDPVVKRLADKYDKEPAQVLIKYHVQVGNLVIPKSSTPQRIESNISVWDFTLAPEELTELSALDCDFRFCSFERFSHAKHFPF